MSNKVMKWVYLVAMFGGFANAYFAYKMGNVDAALAWTVSAGMAGGAHAGYSKLVEKEEEDGEI